MVQINALAIWGSIDLSTLKLSITTSPKLQLSSSVSQLRPFNVKLSASELSANEVSKLEEDAKNYL